MPARDKSGFTLLETLIASALFAMITVALTVLVQTTTVNMGKSKATLMASMLATDKLETIRNSPYASVGTVGGIPDGIFPQEEILHVGGLAFTRTTSVIYIDDPYDGTAPTDTTPTDYKRVRVAVSWGGVFASIKPLVMVTDISPKNVESDEGGGVLRVVVFNALGQTLANANVHIEAPTLATPVDENLQTDVNGEVEIPGADVCTECYNITVTKNDYSTDRTYSRSEVANPAKPPMSIFEDDVSEASFTIDSLSSLSIRAVRSKTFSFAPFQGVAFTLTGSKQIGRTVSDQPVYKTVKALVTGTGGLVTVNNLEWDTYTLSIPVGSSVDFAASMPFSPFPLAPGANGGVTMVVQAASDNSMLVRVTNNLLAPIASSSVTLHNDWNDYIATQSTGVGGDPDRAQAFFPSLPATSSPFAVTITSPGYLPTTTEATVSGDVIEDLILNSP